MIPYTRHWNIRDAQRSARSRLCVRETAQVIRETLAGYDVRDRAAGYDGKLPAIVKETYLINGNTIIGD